MCDIDECQKKCKESPDCAAIDFGKNCNKETCKLFPINKPRENAGVDERIYCEHVGKKEGTK